MTGVLILCGLITWLKLSEPIRRLLHLKPGFANAIIYTLSGFLVAGILLYINFRQTAKSALILLLIYSSGLIAQISFWYFKNAGTSKC
jgi:hypothetical protein